MIFENSSSKGIFRRNIKNSTKWSLKYSSRFLQAAALKVHLTPKFFSLKQILLLSELFPRKNFLIWLKPRFSMPY